MHDEVFEVMKDNIDEKKKIMLRLNPFSMTHEELLSLLAPPEHVKILLEASNITSVRDSGWSVVKVPAYVDDVAGVTCRFRMRTHAYKRPPLAPDPCSWQLTGSLAQIAPAERVIRWLEFRYETGRKFGMLKHVLTELNKVCTHGSQLTYLMPTVSHLCKRGRSTRMDTWLDRFGAYKAVKNAPALSLAMRKATGDAAALLTSVALLGEDVPEPAEGEVEIDAWDLPSVKFEGGFVKRL